MKVPETLSPEIGTGRLSGLIARVLTKHKNFISVKKEKLKFHSQKLYKEFTIKNIIIKK